MSTFAKLKALIAKLLVKLKIAIGIIPKQPTKEELKALKIKKILNVVETVGMVATICLPAAGVSLYVLKKMGKIGGKAARLKSMRRKAVKLKKYASTVGEATSGVKETAGSLGEFSNAFGKALNMTPEEQERIEESKVFWRQH